MKCPNREHSYPRKEFMHHQYSLNWRSPILALLSGSCLMESEDFTLKMVKEIQ